MNVGIIGSGGREHAICVSLKNSEKINNIYCFPGNAGTSFIAQNIEANLNNFEELKHLIQKLNINLIIIGPEKPLVDGLVDYLEENKIKVFGPNKIASQLEGSKIFTKKLCKKYDIPTANFAIYNNLAKSLSFLKKCKFPIVVKADGLAAGKGVTICKNKSQVLKFISHNKFPIVVKADVQGSAEAISQALDKLGTDEVCVRVVHTAVGGITESDITLAAASNASILGFNVRANSQARNLADEQGVEIRYYNVIYDLVDDMKAAMSGMLSPDLRETMLGNAEILEIFNVSKSGKVAGCKVTDGLVRRGASVRLIRDSVVIHEGELSSLRRFKDEVKEVNAGQECGMAFENYSDLKQGDVIECYEVEEIARSLDG